jgi:hypothetical protein
MNIEQYIKNCVITDSNNPAKFNWEYLADNKHVIGLVYTREYKGTYIEKVYHFNKPVILTDIVSDNFTIVQQNEVYISNNIQLPFKQDYEEYIKRKHKEIDVFRHELKQYANMFNRFPSTISINHLNEFFIKYKDKYSYIENNAINISI